MSSIYSLREIHFSDVPFLMICISYGENLNRNRDSNERNQGLEPRCRGKNETNRGKRPRYRGKNETG